MIEASEANPTPSATLAPEMPMGEKTNTTSIKLLIKASNQQHDDQIIDSDLMWTVYRLKTQLSLVYPSKPPVNEQKLIYSGQLLNDRAQLKDIIRSYKDVYTQHHILHLVYTPKNQTQSLNTNNKMTTTPTTSNGSSSNNITSTDGLRQRHNIAATSSSSSSIGNSTNNNTNNPNSNNNVTNMQQMPQFGFLAAAAATGGGLQQQYSLMNNMSGASSPFSGAFDMQTLAAQQAAMYNWMWQTYGQYMQQFSQGNAAQQTPTTNSTAHSTNPLNPVIAYQNLAAPNNGFYPQQPFFGPFPQQQIPSAAAVAAAAAIPNPATTTTTQPAEQQQDQQQQQQQQAEVAAAAAPQPRFPNIVQEEQENRDWLDSFFSIMRLALFLTILYFNSSPMRCLMVFIIAGGIYLYHIGFFRTRQERNNNDINRINNAAAAAAPAQPPQQPAAVVAAAAAAENAANNTPAVDAAATDVNNSNDGVGTDAASIAAQDASVENNSTTVIAFMRSFIVSFFTSLLPEAPAAL